MNSLYAGKASISSTVADEVAAALEAELRQWLIETPRFFHEKLANKETSPDAAFYDVPWIFLRQQRTVQGAFLFANMIIYRRCMLKDLLKQSSHSARHRSCSENVTKCIEYAMEMLSLAAEFGAEESKCNSTFWVCYHVKS